MTRPRGAAACITPAANADVTGVFALLAVLPFAAAGLRPRARRRRLRAAAGAAHAGYRDRRRGVRAAARRAPAPMWPWLVASGRARRRRVGRRPRRRVPRGGGDELAFYLGSLASVALLAASPRSRCPASAARAPPADRRRDRRRHRRRAGRRLRHRPRLLRHGDALLTLVALIDCLALLLVVLAAVAAAAAPSGACSSRSPPASVRPRWATAWCPPPPPARSPSPPQLTAVLWAVAGLRLRRSRRRPSAGRSPPRPPPAVARPARPLDLRAHAAAARRDRSGCRCSPSSLWFAGELETWAPRTFAGVLSSSGGARVRAPGPPADRQPPRRRPRARRARGGAAPQRGARGAHRPGDHDDADARGGADRRAGAERAAPGRARRRAPRCTSAATTGDYELRAAAGDWQTEKTWPGTPPTTAPRADTRGGRAIVRLPVAARGNRIGTVTLVRRADDPFAERELELLGLLVDEIAVALQNARDYREKLEQAIRDPLTGLYNRRFLFEALDKEVARTERYGNDVSLVIFDVDDFKSINDDHGHAAGDDVLRTIGRDRRGGHAPDRLVRAHRRRGVRAAAAGDRAARRAADRRAPAHRDLAPHDPRRPPRHGQRRRRLLPARRARRATSCTAAPTPPCTGPSATARTSARWPARWPTAPSRRGEREGMLAHLLRAGRRDRRAAPAHARPLRERRRLRGRARPGARPRRATASSGCAAPRCCTTSARSRSRARSSRSRRS